jgi:hypothetical protein
MVLAMVSFAVGVFLFIWLARSKPGNQLAFIQGGQMALLIVADGSSPNIFL